MTNGVYHISELRRLAMRYAEGLTEDEKIRKQDLTPILYKELRDMPKHKERINITVNGLPASGKSTAGMAIADFILRTTYKKRMSIEHIAREQGEFMTKWIQNPDKKDTVVLIDEWDDLDDTGENSTTEEALRNLYSKVHAQRNIHMISCTPEGMVDPLSEIILEVQTKNERDNTTYALLYYRLYKGGTKDNILLGHVIINVAWVVNQEWYKDYRNRKFGKMDVMTKHGIFRVKDLKYAELVKDAVSELKEISKLGVIDKDIIFNYLEILAREKRIPFSIIGSDRQIKRVDGILKLYKKREDIELKKYRLRQLKEKNPMETEKIQVKIEELNKANDSIGLILKRQIEDLAYKMRIAEVYESV